VPIRGAAIDSPAHRSNAQLCLVKRKMNKSKQKATSSSMVYPSDRFLLILTVVPTAMEPTAISARAASEPVSPVSKLTGHQTVNPLSKIATLVL
jgi:hypothetical protein